MHWLQHALGIDNSSGPIYLFWSGLGLTIVVGILSWLRNKAAKSRHVKQLAQAAAHHAARLAQAQQHHDEAKAHLAQHLAVHCGEIKEHLAAVVADAQARAGAGSNPANSEGLTAETAPAAAQVAGSERVVPPAATTRRRTGKTKGM